MQTVTLYTRSNCPACQQAMKDLRSLQKSIPHTLVEVELDENPVLFDQLGSQAPVVEIGPYRFLSPFSRQDLQVALGAARDRGYHRVSVGDKGYSQRLKRGHSLTGADRATNWLSNHYVLLFNLIFRLYWGAISGAGLYEDWVDDFGKCYLQSLLATLSPTCFSFVVLIWRAASISSRIGWG